MSRRTFLKSTAGVAFGIPIVTTGTSFYGTPTTHVPPTLANPDSLLRLPLSQAGMSSEMSDLTLKLGGVWHNVLTDRKEAIEFSANTSEFLRKYGLADNLVVATSPEITTLAALLDQGVAEAVLSGDFKSFLSALRARGVLSKSNRSGFRTAMKQLMEQDRAQFAQIFDRVQNISPEERTKLLQGDELQLVYSLLAKHSATDVRKDGDDDGGAAVAAVAAVVVLVAYAAVVAYASVVIAVSLELVVGIHLSIVAKTAVIGPEDPFGDNGGDGYLADGQGSMKGLTGEARSARQQATKLAMLDPDLMREARRVATIAKLSNSDALTLKTNAWLIEQEISAIVDAARDAGIMVVPDVVHEEITMAVTQMALRVAQLEPSGA